MFCPKIRKEPIQVTKVLYTYSASLSINLQRCGRVPIIFLEHVGKTGSRSVEVSMKIRRHTSLPRPPLPAPLSWQYPAQHALLKIGSAPGPSRALLVEGVNWQIGPIRYKCTANSGKQRYIFSLPRAHFVFREYNPSNALMTIIIIIPALFNAAICDD